MFSSRGYHSHEQRFPECFAKLAVWQLVQFDKVLYIDADAVVLRPLESYFDTFGGPFAAVPDCFPPDRFNGGVMLVQPDVRVYRRMLQAARTVSCSGYDGGDTGFLN